MVQSDRAHPGHGRKEIPTLAPSSTSHTPTAESQPVQTLPEEPADSSLPHDRSNLRHQLSAFWHHCNPQKAFENRGSTARDHLASERTFLAYVRTSLALASTGVVLVQLFTIADITSRTYNSPLTEANRRMQRFARPLGVAFVLLALIMLATAVYRFFIIQFSLPGNMFPIARFSVVFYTFVLGALVVVMFGALVGGV